MASGGTGAPRNDGSSTEHRYGKCLQDTKYAISPCNLTGAGVLFESMYENQQLFTMGTKRSTCDRRCLLF